MAETLRDWEMEQMFGKPDKEKETKTKVRPINPDTSCKCVHVDMRTRTSGTPYYKGWCSNCKAWVFTDKTFCICCMKRVKHKIHHLHTKKVMDKFSDEYKDKLASFVEMGMEMAAMMFIETEYKDRRYHIPAKLVAQWSKLPEGMDRKDLMAEILDAITTVRK